MDVIDFVETYIARTIDILWVTATAGILASLSFAEWKRSGDICARQQGGLIQVSLSGFIALLALSLFFGGWHGSIPFPFWALLLLAILSALSITLSIIALRRWMQHQTRRVLRHSREANV